MKTRALVTGASGFIGGRLTEMLLADGVDVTPIGGRGATKSPSLSLQWPDLRAPPPTPSGSFDYVFHLAAATDLKWCNAHPELAQAVNMAGAGHSVELAAQTGARFVLVSTLGVYGDPKYVPVDEEHPTVPKEAYAASKLAAEGHAMERADALGVAWVIVRSFNAYGPGQRNGSVVPSIVRQAVESDVVELWNSSTTRDFIFVDDVCRALWSAVTKCRAEVLNAGTGVETSVLEVVETVGELLGRTLEVSFRSEAGSYPNVSRSCASIDRIRSLTGWEPIVTLREGLKRMIESRGWTP